MSQPSVQLNTIAYGVIILAAITAFIHLYLSFQFKDGPDLPFLLNGIGYLVLLGAIYAPIPFLTRYRSLFCWLLIAYTALTIVLWFFFGANVWYAYVDKAVEIALILFVWLETRRFSE